MEKKPIIRRVVDPNLLKWCFNCWAVGLHEEKSCPQVPLTFPERDKLRQAKKIPMLVKWKAILFQFGHKELAEGVNPYDYVHGKNLLTQDIIKRGESSIIKSFGNYMKEQKDGEERAKVMEGPQKEVNMESRATIVDTRKTQEETAENQRGRSRSNAEDEITKRDSYVLHTKRNLYAMQVKRNLDIRSSNTIKGMIEKPAGMQSQQENHGHPSTSNNVLVGSFQPANINTTPSSTPASPTPTPNTLPARPPLPAARPTAIGNKVASPPVQSSTPSPRVPPTERRGGLFYVPPVKVQHLSKQLPPQTRTTITYASTERNCYNGPWEMPPDQKPTPAFPNEVSKLADNAPSSTAAKAPLTSPATTALLQTTEMAASLAVPSAASVLLDSSELLGECNLRDLLANKVSPNSSGSLSIIATDGSVNNEDINSERDVLGGGEESTASYHTAATQPQGFSTSHQSVPQLPKRSLRLVFIDLATRVFTIQQRRERFIDELVWLREDVEAVNFRFDRLRNHLRDRLDKSSTKKPLCK